MWRGLRKALHLILAVLHVLGNSVGCGQAFQGTVPEKGSQQPGGLSGRCGAFAAGLFVVPYMTAVVAVDQSSQGSNAE